MLVGGRICTLVALLLGAMSGTDNQCGSQTCEAARIPRRGRPGHPRVERSTIAPKKVTFLSVNDVYKLVGLPHKLEYIYLKEDVDYIRNITSLSCDGQYCGSDIPRCGLGTSWEACFPLAFDRVRTVSMKTTTTDALAVLPGPCSTSETWTPGDDEEQFGSLVDFAANFKWLKEDVAAGGDLAIGTLAGDFIGPSYLANLFEGKQLVEVMNLMGVDLANIGNHDVDFGLETLQGQMAKSAFHYLNANLLAKNGSEIEQPMTDAATIQGNDMAHPTSAWRNLENHGKGWAMLDAEGVKVCVLGTTDIDKMNWPGKKIQGVERDIPVALAILDTWEEMGLDCTLRIAMTHTRSGNDFNLFRAVEDAGHHLDAIIAAHDHYMAFAELMRKDGGITYFVKAGADARIISKLTFDVQVSPPVGKLELVPVVSGRCEEIGPSQDAGRQDWLRKAKDLFDIYATEADDLNKVPMHVKYFGVYDSSSVRDAESRAVNLWLDLMRESLNGDILFFQAGLVRQDMSQDFGASGVELSRLFMFEEFPWGDQDIDRRSSLFPFRVSVEMLVTKTVPFVAKKYWCNAPFNDANRIHMSGLVVEMVSGADCSSLSPQDLIQSITFAGNCHRKGALLPESSGCCTSPLCGRWWTRGAWSQTLSMEQRAQQLTVLTGQFCVPSKYGTHGEGFHEAGMLCKDAEAAENWASGAAFAEAFAGEGVWNVRNPQLDEFALPEQFTKLGYFFKQSMEALLSGQSPSMPVGNEGEAECRAAETTYLASTFLAGCYCEQGVRSGDTCGEKQATTNGFPRFYAAASEGFGP